MIAKQSTAKSFLVGPILDADGVAKTDEVVASIKVTKNGSVGAPNGSSTLTHNHTGHYVYAAATGDFDTLGEVEFSLNSGTNAMAPVKFQVVPANTYDYTVAAFGLATPTNITAASGVSLAASQHVIVDSGTVTTLTNLPAITAGWLTADGIDSSALNGKGDWNIGKTGYSLTQTFPTNFSSLAITVGGAVTAGTVSDKTGYSLSVTPPTAAAIRTEIDANSTKLDVAVSSRLASTSYTAPDNASITLILADTNELQTDWSDGGRLDLILDSLTSGTGATEWTYTLTNSVGGTPIADADIWITSDISGATVIASGKTNSSGVVTFYLDLGATVYVWRAKSGFDFTNPDTEIIS